MAGLASCSYGYCGPRETLSTLMQFQKPRSPQLMGKSPEGLCMSHEKEESMRDVSQQAGSNIGAFVSLLPWLNFWNVLWGEVRPTGSGIKDHTLFPS